MEFVKRANTIFKNHKRMLEDMGINVKTMLIVKDLGVKVQ
jgi:hypothetical protein